MLTKIGGVEALRVVDSTISARPGATDTASSRARGGATPPLRGEIEVR
jgi:hypothetical protein